MEIISQDRRDWLYRQVALTVLNDGAWHREVTKSDVCEDCFGYFSKVTRPYVNKLCPGMVDSEVEMGFVLACVWDEATCVVEKEDLTLERVGYYRDQRNNGRPNGQYLTLRHLDGAEQHLTPLPAGTPATTQPNEIKEPTMKTEQIVIQTITYINGADISKMTSDQLIDAIQTCENEIETLGKIATKSKAITAKVERIKATIKQLVAILDDSSAA